MTYIPETVAEYKDTVTPQPVMAILNEFGQETPITEQDIQRSLKLMSEEQHETPAPTAIDALMEHVDAARAIA
ncbi:MAG: hypothetical protein KAQ67_05800 [Gammaproteobacteria bacterium]|nr:hypothetical protein [Gammaproteobacteria bacterium]